MADPMDIVIPLGRGSQFKNCELRYALRSIEKHARGVRNIVIVGERPKYLSSAAIHLPCPWFDMNKEARIAHKVLFAFENAEDLTEEVLFFNDDFVLTKPVDIRKIPDYQRGRLIDSAKANLKAPHERPGLTTYQQALKDTHDALTAAGLPAYHYDLHCPIRLKRKKFLELKPLWKKSAEAKYGFVMKSIFGNHVHPAVPGPRWNDCKIGQYKGPEPLLKKVAGRWMFSYSDRALFAGMEQALHDFFPQKSRYEAWI